MTHYVRGASRQGDYMTLDELATQVLAILPDAIFDERDGEVIIATGMALVNDSDLVSIEEAVFGNEIPGED